MKPVNVYTVLESMINRMNPDHREAQVISDLLDTLKRWEMTIDYYARGNYDRGVLARQAQGYNPPEDQRPLRQMAAQGARMRPQPDETEN